jgi:hypothetical protein
MFSDNFIHILKLRSYKLIPVEWWIRSSKRKSMICLTMQHKQSILPTSEASIDRVYVPWAYET